MSAQNRETLEATIYNLSCGDAELFATLAELTDAELEQVLTDLLKK